MKKQFRIINTPKGILNITSADLNEVVGESTTNKQKIISSSTYTITDADLNYTLFFSNGGAVAVTIGALAANFECDLWNTATTGTVTFAGSGIILTSPEGFKLEANKVGACLRMLNTSSYRLKGEFAI